MTTEYVFDRQSLKRLETAYKNAKKQNRESFRFDGHELLCDYAKYLIEYLKSQLEPRTA